jgi:hypothetical protein
MAQINGRINPSPSPPPSSVIHMKAFYLEGDTK